MSVLLSSHLVSDVERVCDHVIVLVDSRVQVNAGIDDLLTGHHRVTGPTDLPADHHALTTSRTADDRTTHVVRTDAPIRPPHDPAWTVEPLSLEDIVLAYIGRRTTTAPAPGLRPTDDLETRR
ncbi:hypothetical protein [Streptomyces sp. NPDC058330]|uniref:hypothetical protein n=1 Tax=Streptomyces sp. NPDC058330 TaxID=3346449 RepID=UPI0036EE6E5C